jgi:hypothetical protein
MIAPEHLPSLIDLCDKAVTDLAAFDSGVDYQKLQISRTFATLCTPLIANDDLIPELRRSVEPIELYAVKNSVFKLLRAHTYSKGTARGEFEPAVLSVKSLLLSYQASLPQQGKLRSGAWTVFYSWQSTLPNSTNRGFIRTSLDKAVAEINRETVVEDSVRIDSDTNGRPGSPKIFETILDKISSCDVFVADVTLVSGKQSNSNVMVELGYALSKLGPEGIVMVCNTAFGEIADLPFDLGFNRVIPYACAEGESDKATIRADFARKLKAAIEGVCAAA